MNLWFKIFVVWVLPFVVAQVELDLTGSWHISELASPRGPKDATNKDYVGDQN